MCARTRCPLASSTRNMAFGNGSPTRPSISMAPSFFGMSSGLCLNPWRMRACKLLARTSQQRSLRQRAATLKRELILVGSGGGAERSELGQPRLATVDRGEDPGTSLGERERVLEVG